MQLDATISSNGPSNENFKIFEKVVEKLIVYMKNKEKKEWEGLRYKLDWYSRKQIEPNANDLLKSLIEEYNTLCYEFL